MLGCKSIICTSACRSYRPSLVVFLHWMPRKISLALLIGSWSYTFADACLVLAGYGPSSISCTCVLNADVALAQYVGIYG